MKKNERIIFLLYDLERDFKYQKVTEIIDKINETFKKNGKIDFF
jgi:hypothetical protein